MNNMSNTNNIVYCEIDYHGNMYFKFRGSYYYPTFNPSKNSSDDNKTLELTKLSKNTSDDLQQTLIDYPQKKHHAKLGNIILTESSLRGKINKILSKKDDIHDDGGDGGDGGDEGFLESYNLRDTDFVEAEYFKIEKKKNDLDNDFSDDDYSDDDLDDWDVCDDNVHYTSSEIDYIFCGVNDNNANFVDETNDIVISKNVIFSDMLRETYAFNDTIIIDGDKKSKIVTFAAQKTDGFCTTRMILFSDNIIKIQYPNIKTSYFKFASSGDDLLLKNA